MTKRNKAIKTILVCAIMERVIQKLNLLIWQNNQVISAMAWSGHSVRLRADNRRYQRVIDKVTLKLERRKHKGK